MKCHALCNLKAGVPAFAWSMLRAAVIVALSSVSIGTVAAAELPPAYPGEQPAVDMVLAVSGFGVADADGRVRAVGFRDRSVTDDQLRVLSGLQLLEEVDLDNNDVTDRTAAVLAGCPNIARLSLVRTKITDVGMAHLGGLKKLTRLVLSETAIGDEGLAALGALPLLEELYLENTHIGDAGLACLARFPKLKVISLKGRIAPVGGGKAIALAAGCDPVSSGCEAAVASDCEAAAAADDKAPRGVITDRGLAYLGGSVRLEWLHLERAQITDAGLSRLAGLTRLTLLDLTGAPISGAGLRHLKPLGELRELKLNETRFQSANVPLLLNFRRLHTLSLDDTEIDDADLPILAELAELQSLFLDGTKITNAGLRHLPRAKRLTRLGAHRTTVDEVGEKYLRGELPECSLDIDQRLTQEAFEADYDERRGYLTKLYTGDRAAFREGLKKIPDLLAWKYPSYSPDHTEFENLEPLTFASQKDDLDLTRFLLDLGARPNRPECDALSYAKSLAMAELLVKHGAIVEPKTKMGDSPLFSAPNRAIAEFYLRHGGDLKRVGNEGRTPLHAAVASGRFEVVRLFVERVAEVDASHQYALHSCWGQSGLFSHGTPLLVALVEKRFEIAEWLVEHGAKHDLSADGGADALRKAVSRGNVAMARFLIKHGVDPRRKTPGTLPIVAALVSEGWGDAGPEMLATLLDAGADINAATSTDGPGPSRDPFHHPERDERGWTPLHFAVAEALPDAVRLLLARGADANAKSKAGLTPQECIDETAGAYTFKELIERRRADCAEIRKLLDAHRQP